jgi:glycerol-1-phosphate dehydrogenase [NAD(P)+]
VSARPQRTICVPRLLHASPGCIDDVASLLADNDFDLGRVLVGSGPGPSRLFARRVVTALREHDAEVLEVTHLTGRLEQGAAAAATIIEREVTTAIAVGGGRVLDPLKLAAARTGVDFVSVPTTIAHDGISSPVASLVGRDGVRASHAAQLPCGIIVDVEAVGSAPPPTIRAGVGDLVSNLVACLDWRLADREGHDRYDAFSAMIAEAAARPALDLAEIDSAASHEVLAQGLLLSGLAMATAGTSRPCSGAEHLISHALDAQLGRGSALHGEQVALGCLVAAAAHGSPLLGTFREVFGRLGVPTRPQALGMSDEQLVEAVVAAPSLRPDRWTVLSGCAGDRDAAERFVHAAFDAGPRALTPAAS